MSKYTFDENIVSDLYKDTFGHRPTSSFWMDWESTDDDGRQAQWDQLLETHEEELKAAELRTVQSQEAFEARIRHVIEAGAYDRATALRWLFQSSDNEDQVSGQDYEHFLWENEVLFSDRSSEYLGYLKEAA